MDRRHAEQIAKLLNERNQLVEQYTADYVLSIAHRLLCHLDEHANVFACVEVKKVQWYQCEILHLSTSESVARTGIASGLLADAERKAESSGARVIQCTIREDNLPSEKFFSKHGYKNVSSFFNYISGKRVSVWQKICSNAL